MREILFRGKVQHNKYQKNEGMWVEGAYYHQTEFYGSTNWTVDTPVDEHYIITSKDELEDNMMECYKVIPETVGQYTGLTVGAEKLFEGDIVEWYEDYDDCWGYCHTAHGYSVMAWDNENYCWCFKTNDNIAQSLSDWDWENCFITGNIHDNPELLEG